MSTARSVDRSAVAHQNPRASLCPFTFSDGRRCRSPRSDHLSHLCPYHLRKEAQSKAADKLSRDISYFLSGDYLSACDLGTALGRLIPAVIRGDVKPKIARTVAYLAQTLAQTIHLAQHEYINSFGTDTWRRTLRNSVNQNSDYHNPSPPDESPQSLDQPQPPSPQPQPNLHPADAAPQLGSSALAPPPSQPAQATLQPGVVGLNSGSPIPASPPPRPPASPNSPPSSPLRAQPSPPPSHNFPNRGPAAIRAT